MLSARFREPYRMVKKKRQALIAPGLKRCGAAGHMPKQLQLVPCGADHFLFILHSLYILTICALLLTRRTVETVALIFHQLEYGLLSPKVPQTRETPIIAVPHRVLTNPYTILRVQFENLCCMCVRFSSLRCAALRSKIMSIEAVVALPPLLVQHRWRPLAVSCGELLNTSQCPLK